MQLLFVNIRSIFSSREEFYANRELRSYWEDHAALIHLTPHSHRVDDYRVKVLTIYYLHL